MKINSKILSLPPYISTGWENVALLQLDNHGNLLVHLKNGLAIAVPNLSGETIETVFNAHREHLEMAKVPDFPKAPNFSIGLNSGMPGLEPFGMNGMVQHDVAQKDSPDLPPEILNKISSVAKALNLEVEAFQLIPSEPHCNCPFCQISRKLSDDHRKQTCDELDISDKELHFKEWDIKQVGEKLYDVTNPLEMKERYQVFLGKPIGCTCGKNNCEHIVAVLNS